MKPHLRQYFPTLPLSRLVRGLAVGAVSLAVVVGPALPCMGQESGTGSIKGRVLRADTKEPLVAANVVILDTNRGTSTNALGEYVLPDVPAGAYRVVFQYMGYEGRIQPDVVVRPGRITRLEVELVQTVLEGERVVVTAGYFATSEQETTPVVALTADEVRRAPGSAGDVSRILQAMPSAAAVTDAANDLAVRGGSPMENGFYVDGIQVPNINHFPAHGSSGGPIGFLNVDLIDDVTYSAGGFGVAYGDRLSSIVDITLREGNRDEFDGQADLHLAGVGGVLEGPLGGGRGSWLLSARRSYLDLVIGSFDAGGLPRYGDVHAKVVYDVTPSHRLTVLDLYGYSGQEYSRDDAVEAGLQSFGNLHDHQNTLGLSWRALWGGRGYTETALSWNRLHGGNDWFSTATLAPRERNYTTEERLRFRTLSHLAGEGGLELDLGLEAEWDRADFDYDLAGFTDRLGQSAPALRVERDLGLLMMGVLAGATVAPADGLRTTLGVRIDRVEPSGSTLVSPRFAARFRLSETVELSAAEGIYHQRLPAFLIFQDPANERLAEPRARHLVLGMGCGLAPDTRLTVEVYEKRYDRLPMLPSDPTRFVLDEGTSLVRFGGYGDLIASGKALARGVEVLLQKRLARALYGLVSASWFRTRYCDLAAVWHDRAFDNRYLFHLMGGWRPNRMWEVSGRWTLAGGRPYTPFDVAASLALGSGVIDQARINGARYPAYHALDLRLDRRFFFRRSSIVAYVSLWNAYDRRNVEAFYWDEVNNRLATANQWRCLPVIGFEYEF